MILPVFSGCGGNAGNIIYLNLLTPPETLDPQLAKSDEELLICRNLYEGLLRKNEEGKIVNGACKSYKKSGLTYTFTLRSDAKWSNGKKVTADDFVFAFRRAVTPAVEAPFARRLRNIKNAQSVLNGTADPSTLGVTAKSDTSLTIELASEDKYFEDTLTTPVCMPCRQSFFNGCNGKYGRDGDCVLANGSYYLKSWRTDEFGIRIIKNDKYSGDFKPKNGGIVITANQKTEVRKLFSKNSVDCAFVDNRDVNSVKSEGAKLKTTQNICWFMTIGNTYSADIRNAFCLAFDEGVYKSSLNTGFSVSKSIYPGVLGVKNADGVGLSQYNLENAKAIFSSAVKKTEDKIFPSATMYYYPDDYMLPVTKSIIGHYQQNLSAFINISPAKHPEELKEELKAFSLQFAMFPVKATGSDITEYLVNFGIYDTSDTTAAQQRILAQKTVIPVCCENTNFCYSQKLSNINFTNFDGYIDFSFVIKK